MESLDKIDWENMSNSKIKSKLEEIWHEHITIKDKISKMLETLDVLEKEYLFGSKIRNKRLNGE